MKLLITLVVTCLISSSNAQGLVSPIVEDMHKVFNKSDFKKLRDGQMIMRKKNVNKSAWPELTFYLVIDSDPLHSIGVFAAYEHQKNYVPDLLVSNVIQQKSPTEVIVQYKLKMPWPLSDSDYKHGHVLKLLDSDTYKLDWYMIESDTAEIVKGFAEFYPFEGKTVLKYRSFINPSNILAGLLKKTMIKDVKKSLEAIRAEIIRLKGKPESVKFSGLIKTALSGKYAYENGRPAK
jgi:hypothetical protein